MKHIVFTGPECSGKTTLSKKISKKFKLPLVPEYAREYLKSIKQNYQYKDLNKIAKKQLELELEKSTQLNKKNILICDTNLQVIKLWSLIKYDKCDDFILQNQNKDALYILCKPDFKWEYDPLRENPLNRKNIFKRYQKELTENNLNFVTASGSIEKRINQLTRIINKFLY